MTLSDSIPLLKWIQMNVLMNIDGIEKRKKRKRKKEKRLENIELNDIRQSVKVTCHSQSKYHRCHFVHLTQRFNLHELVRISSIKFTCVSRCSHTYLACSLIVEERALRVHRLNERKGKTKKTKKIITNDTIRVLKFFTSILVYLTFPILLLLLLF